MAKRQIGGYLQEFGWSRRALLAMDEGLVPGNIIYKLTGISQAVMEQYYQPREWHHVTSGDKVKEIYFYDPEAIIEMIFYADEDTLDMLKYAVSNKGKKFINDILDSQVDKNGYMLNSELEYLIDKYFGGIT